MTRSRHAADHFFRGVCICACKACTVHPTTSSIKCTCPECPPDACGLKTARVVI